MASRPKGYGMTAELAAKKAEKWDHELVQEAMDWISEIVPGSNVKGLTAQSDIHDRLKDGVILCQLINSISPGAVKKINESKMAFKMMENIGNFLDACENYGILKQDLFQTVDLYEMQNMPQVINGIFALGRKAQAKGYSGPKLGPAEAERNHREFTEEQLRSGQGVIGLQAGSNRGASQHGQNFGRTRAIID